jgi:ATP-dependent Clp protease protease subunit
VPQVVKPISDKSFFSVKAKTADTAEMLIYGVVGGDGFFEEGITSKDVHTQLRALGKNIKNLDLRINSVGGDVFDGFAIYNLLKQSGLNITTYVDGLAASIASVIALAGKTVVMGSGAQMMIHSAWTYAAGNARDFENVVDRLLTIDDQLINTYVKKSKKSKSEIQGLVQAETWFTADQAIEFGLADSKAENTLAIAARLVDKATWMNKVPRKEIITENSVAKSRVNNILKKFEEFNKARK